MKKSVEILSKIISSIVTPLFIILVSFGCASVTPRSESVYVLPAEASVELTQKFTVTDKQDLKVDGLLPTDKPLPKMNSKNKTAKAKKPKKQLTPVDRLPSSVTPLARKIDYLPFKQGEVFLYTLSALGIHAANLRVTVLPDAVLNSKPVFHFMGQVFTTALFSAFFKVNDVVESFSDKEGLFSFRYQVHGDEGPLYKNNTELYDYDSGQSLEYKEESKDGHKNSLNRAIGGLEPYSQDLLSFLYYLRTLDMKDSSVQTFPVASGDRHIKANLLALGTEECQALGRDVTCNIFSLSYEPNTPKEQNRVWITNDADRLVVKIVAKIRVGNFSVQLSGRE